jgi:hypothetical protein
MRETFQTMLARHRREREALEVEERADARAAMQREREERAAEETRQNQANLQRRIDETTPEQVLTELASAGISVRLNDDGTISVTPGVENMIQKWVIQNKRDEVIALLRERQRIQII